MRVCLIISILLLSVHNIGARTCATTVHQQDTWTSTNIDLLIQKAKAAYSEDSAEAAYKRTLSQIARTIKRCKLSEDAEFVNRHSTFLEYIGVLSLPQEKDHELGFEVPDQTYFAETHL